MWGLTGDPARENVHPSNPIGPSEQNSDRPGKHGHADRPGSTPTEDRLDASGCGVRPDRGFVYLSYPSFISVHDHFVAAGFDDEHSEQPCDGGPPHGYAQALEQIDP